MTKTFNGIYAGKRVFLTGHTGFKGSWLAYWLTRLGAQVTGYSLQAPSTPSHWEILGMDINSVIGDIRNSKTVKTAMESCRPDIVFHLAAQPLVRDSYTDPVNTYSTNVMGTMHVLDRARSCPSVQAIVAITTDKVYRNREWQWPYREIDELGGHDPYSSSKACAEILISSYRASFFNTTQAGTANAILLASARAGNVIGGGDWARDRLIPDIMRATAAGETVIIRNPHATRPWQHVLECLSGYLLLGQGLLEGNAALADSFNFGPAENDTLSVAEIARRIVSFWPEARFQAVSSDNAPHEARLLALDCAKSRATLRWQPVWDVDTALERTVAWYRSFYEQKTATTHEDLDAYVNTAQKRSLVWA